MPNGLELRYELRWLERVHGQHVCVPPRAQLKPKQLGLRLFRLVLLLLSSAPRRVSFIGLHGG